MSDRLGPYVLGPTDDESQGVYAGDARELAWLVPDESVNIAVVDPPYGIKWRCAWRTASERFLPIEGDDAINTSWLPRVYDILIDGGAFYCFTRWDVMPTWKIAIEGAGFTVKNCIVWDKGFHGAGDLEGAFAPQHELIVFAVKGRHILNKRQPDIIRINRVNPNDLIHPAQKPVDLMCYLIDASTKRNDVVIDFFCGSGTVQVAASSLGRRWLAFEIDPDTADLARERIRNTQPPLPLIYHEQQPLFEVAP